ncbi:hypothetical protein GW17_00060675, partial [Ensete ventricosum]
IVAHGYFSPHVGESSRRHETVQSGICCATTGAKLTEVRGITNSKSLVLMQGLVCGRWSVRGYPKAIGTWHHGAFKLSLRHGKDMSIGG